MFKTKTKIVATLGPSSADVVTIEKMIKAGLSVARLNMSHGDHAQYTELIKNAREAAQKAGRPLAILQDLSGPKIRIGDFTTETVTLVKGKKLVLTTKPGPGTVDRVFVNYKKLPQEVKSGITIYLNDGKQQLRVDRTTETEVHTTIMVGGTIRGRRGVNVPNGYLSIAALTAKDKKDLVYGLSQGVTFVTLSFVRSAKDIVQLRKLIGDHDVAIVAKIETKSAVDNLEEIVDAADAIMVARGDLAIEIPAEQVPLMQKRIIQMANRRGKPVITATQMLDSMRVSVTPTRAEVNDIANAIIDGTDAVMLSDETAVGENPVAAVATMARVATEIESDGYLVSVQQKWDFKPVNNCDAVSRSIVRSVEPTGAVAIVALSESGYTGRMVARYRPQVPVLVLTPRETTLHKMQLVFGCEAQLVKGVDRLRVAQKVAMEAVVSHKIGKIGDTFIIGAGVPFGKPGSTNMMLIRHIHKATKNDEELV